MERERNLLLHGQGEKSPEAGNSKQQDIISRKRAKVSIIKFISDTATIGSNISQNESVSAESLSTQQPQSKPLRIPPELAYHPVFLTNRQTNKEILERRAKV